MPTKFAATLSSALLLATPSFGQAEDAPVEVMIVGTFHMANPGRDIHNLTVDDMLAPERQKQIQAAVDGIAKFHPTMVDVERDSASKEYAQYLAGTYKKTPNEVVQLGFRLAKQSGLTAVHGVDVDGAFPYGPVQDYAAAHGQKALLDAQGAAVDAMLAREKDILDTKGVSADLRMLNDPKDIEEHGNDFYRTTLKIGGGTVQPGADLLTAWYHRNFMICANIIQFAKPGDRVVVFYGSGHALLLRQCIRETPGFKLIEANDYLPE